MLNNLTNFLNLKGLKRFKTIPEPKDVFPMGTVDRKFRGGYKPTAIQWEDLLAAVSAGTIQDLASVLATGNITNGTNISVTSGDNILLDSNEEGGSIASKIQFDADTFISLDVSEND